MEFQCEFCLGYLSIYGVFFIFDLVGLFWVWVYLIVVEDN